jgi:hypothetical protein
MNSNSDSNDQVEPVVKEEKPITSKSIMEFHHKKFHSIPEANFANNPNSNEFLEGGQETSEEKLNVTAQQYIKQELDTPNAILDNPRSYKSWNPWAVSSIFEFNYFCCPECDFSTRSDFKTESIQEFINHASSHHPWVSYRVKREG